MGRTGRNIALKLPNHFIFLPGLSQPSSDPRKAPAPAQQLLFITSSVVVPGSCLLGEAGVSEAALNYSELDQGRREMKSAGFDPPTPEALGLLEILTLFGSKGWD